MKRPMLLAVTLLCAGCAGVPGLQAPEGEPYVRGPIESITHHATASRVLVRAGPGSREPCGISATVDDRTRLLRRGPGGALRPGSRETLEVGDTVEVFVDGPVMESCPVQGHASSLVVVGPAAS